MSQTPTSSIGPAGVVRLPDGRSITVSAAGPADGFPVVYCHGAIGSPRWRTPDLDRLIERLSICYLVINRPGFAGSDPSPGRTVADFARDVGEVMSILGHRRFSVVGVSAGAPYALACGWALAERLVGLAAVSPLGPSDGCGASRGLRYRVPLVSLRSGRTGPTLAWACLRALGLDGQTPTAAMIDDYVVCRRHWGFDPAEVRFPVTLWHGGADRLVPLAHARALAAAIPGCTSRVSPGGHFFYSRSLAEIIGSLLPEAPDVGDPVELMATRSVSRDSLVNRPAVAADHSGGGWVAGSLLRYPWEPATVVRRGAAKGIEVDFGATRAPALGARRAALDTAQWKRLIDRLVRLGGPATTSSR